MTLTFNDEELLDFCNDTQIRGYSQFVYIKNYLLLRTAIKKIDDEIKKYKYNKNSIFAIFHTLFHPIDIKSCQAVKEFLLNYKDLKSFEPHVILQVADTNFTFTRITNDIKLLDNKLKNVDYIFPDYNTSQRASRLCW